MEPKWFDSPELRLLTESDLRQGMALGLYSGWQLTLESAAKLAGMNEPQFEMLLRKRCIPRHYIRTEIAEGSAHMPSGKTDKAKT